MIEMTAGTLEERIIKLLQETYPVTIYDLKQKVDKKFVIGQMDLNPVFVYEDNLYVVDARLILQFH